MVRNDRRTRLLPKIVLAQSFAALVITCIALFVIFYAEGYRLDFSTFRVVKTGVLYLEFKPHDVMVSWGNNSENAASSFIENLTPGFYDVTISKPGFVIWRLPLRVQSRSVNDYSNIVLFLSDAKATILTDPKKIAILNAPTDALATNAPDQLLFNKYEIRIGDQLVTRFASPIQNAIWYPDLAHIVYQQGKDIRVIEINGRNDTFLTSLSSESSTTFAVGNRGTELYFLDSGQYKMATIR